MGKSNKDNDSSYKHLMDIINNAMASNHNATLSVGSLQAAAPISQGSLVNMNPYTATWHNNTIPGSTSLNNLAPRFHEADRVVLVNYNYGATFDKNPHANPIWGEKNVFISGTITNVESRQDYNNNTVIFDYIVKWDDGFMNRYEESVSGDLCGLEFLNIAEQQRKKPTAKKKLDTAVLDRLILKDETKQEIVAVLKQHNNIDKIFKEWGLGEVIEYGKGMTFMFHGGPGTGKTWAANLIAKAVGTELFTISAAEIQSSEPGGANRNIQQAFANAKEKGLILFLDECDSLIFNREHLGMILGSEVNTLLTEIEKFEGVLILATNRIGEMDAALERRISLIVEFPSPTFEQRKAIWKGLLPSKMPLTEDVTHEELAKHEITGGLIKNVVLQAARLASSEDAKAVSMEHFNKAITRTLASSKIMGAGKHGRQFEGGDVGTGKVLDVKKTQIDNLFNNYKKEPNE